MMTTVENTKSYICQYCSSGFTREKTLAVHVCEQKRRALARTEKHVVLGYDTYNRFYRKTQNSKQDKTYDEFARSPYYNAFVKFGSFVNNVCVTEFLFLGRIFFLILKSVILLLIRVHFNIFGWVLNRIF